MAQRQTKAPPLGYDPAKLPRELKRHYISAGEEDIRAMLREIGVESLEALYDHVPPDCRFEGDVGIPEELDYSSLQSHLFELSQKNRVRLSFLGDGLPQYRVPWIVPHVLGIRKLTTSYTPYQPERSQGTLISHWLYQCAIAAVTGFEAVNASFYDRATALFEAIKCAQRLVPGSATAIAAGSLYPGDIEVLGTLARDTDLGIRVQPLDSRTGKLSVAGVAALAKEAGKELAALCFPQANCLGNLEDVDELTDLARELGVKSIAVIDPILLGPGGLKPPVDFGRKGADMFVAEGQHLAIGPNYGGPGLGVFGIRFTKENRNDIRQTAGRFVGKGKDLKGRDAYAIVLATREQHIRRDKATSNICSNQAFIATLAGAALLERGAEGLGEACGTARKNALSAARALCGFEGVSLAFPESPFFNEFVLRLPVPAKELIAAAREADIQVGVDVSPRIEGSRGEHLLISFSDLHAEADLKRLSGFFQARFARAGAPSAGPKEVPDRHLRKRKLDLPRVGLEELKAYYDKLGRQNVSPDDNIYALGSCTMKYNPYINDWAASLPGFTGLHPEAPEEDAQGSLEVLYATQEYFKAVTGLAAVTTQPVAGAQGELVGIKMFQAYHRDRGDRNRDVILIPRTAHGTNPATATMAGFHSRVADGLPRGVVLIESDAAGRMDMDHLRSLVETHGERICGVMVTNPNTSGILETRFQEMAELIHGAGGLVYMDGANMNAIAGWVDLGKLGVDAVHNNTHKTWTIPHGGGGPGDAFVAVSERLADYLPGLQAVKGEGGYRLAKPPRSIGSVHRHYGNFAHKVRCYAYLRALGREGVRRMSAVAVLSARYLYKRLSERYPTLPADAEKTPRMHEFILTLSPDSFARIEAAGAKRAVVIPRVGKLFLDFGLHAPTVAFPEVYGLMVEPTESYSKAELDRFAEVVLTIYQIVHENPEVLESVPHFTPIDRVDETAMNKDLRSSEPVRGLPVVLENRVAVADLDKMTTREIWKRILQAHREFQTSAA
ncbi:MAG: aminomethyl-transferring glycine dehydrogenase subunit GcvPB [Candidatus Tectomicrobia bacterium]|nr:aminomethyl-transferring glycine dehydrogenase subunit GcvPB [Candidatus Tectomicrobia bacterium]